MKSDDLTNALQFLNVIDDGIVIQCPTAQDVPLIKRFLIAVMHEPDRMIGHTFYYGGKYIAIRPVMFNRTSCLAYRDEQLFYVGWDDEQDLYDLSARQEMYSYETPVECVASLWKVMNVSVADMYKWLLDDGHRFGQVIQWMQEYANRECVT